MTVKIIAEAGVNHNGDLSLGQKMVETAAECGADIIKFQSYNASASISKSARKAGYQQRNFPSSETQLEMVSKLELSREAHKELIRTCRSCNIEFMSTAFDIESLAMLSDLGVAKNLKIPSGEITNVPLLRKFCEYEFEKVYLSTGMANLGEIERALNIMLDSGIQRKKITILHCTTEYPAPDDQINLRSMLTVKDAFQMDIGFSDHSRGIEIPFAAVALGAKVIEKHFTLDRLMEGPDHLASIEPDMLRKLVKGVRKIELALGSYVKAPTEAEKPNIISARKSIVAKTTIHKGDIFSEENLTTKRPGDGISADKWDFIMGKVSRLKFNPDEKIVL